MSMTRTRFAPSPSGYLHLGGARTALFAWAWARQNAGEFILRIEDTDSARSDSAHSDAIIAAMKWLGLNYDGEVRFQSKNLSRHQQVAAQLLESGAAYEDGGALRIATGDDGEVFFDDLVCGRLAVQNKELENPVILRGDKTPTYIFASAIDDMDEGISEVIRGDDHVRNTHKQLHLYRALNKTPPRFAHLPMILSPTGERLSKRHAAVDVMDYQRGGFLSQAIVNYLARLSWGHGDAEIFDLDFLIKHFNFESVQRAPARFDMAKLSWLNGEHLRVLSPAVVREHVQLPNLSDAAINLILPRSETLLEIGIQASYFLERPTPSVELVGKYINDENRAALKSLFTKLENLPEWNAVIIKNAMKEAISEHKLKFAQIGMPFRILLTGNEKSPDIAEVAAVLGQEETMGRMEEAVK